ncbi:MAG: hypothetical protein J6J42_10990 [Lachnospiraceae bacterium]|nr:hypothetical protein [Lachnospiraceae bacterium]
MNESYEQEIDLKWLIYRVLRAWRSIVVWAIIIGVVIGLGSIALWGLKCLDPEYIETEKLNFEREHASWVATGENFEAQLENIAEAKEEQTEYNEKSVLMQIDPLREFNASFELYVNYDYQIMPDMAYQNIDLSDRILKAYATYMTNGELHQYIIDNVSYEIERRYLGEILGVSVDYNNNMISVSVRQQSAEYCQEILDLVQTALYAKYEDISSMIAEHTLSTTNASSYETVNLALQETQKANRQAVTNLDISMQEVNEAYLEWKEEPEPEAEYTLSEVIKNAIKLVIIGGVIGGVVMVVVVAFSALMSGKLLNSDDIKNRFGLRVIGQLPGERVKKPFAFVSRWFSVFGGITVTPEDYERLAKMVGTSIKSDLVSRKEAVDWKKIAFTGMVSTEELEKAVTAMSMDKSYTAICAPDILTNAESIEKVAGADCIILVEKQEQTKVSDIAKEMEALKAWNKIVLGIVIVNADAVM